MDLTAEERPADSSLIELIWHSHSGSGGAFISMAESHSSLVITRIRGKTIVTVRGPEIRATPAGAPEDAEFFGILFKPGVYMPHFPASKIRDRRDVKLPEASRNRFWINGAEWQLPSFENVDTFIRWLVRDELLVYDPLIHAVLRGEPLKMSQRTVQRRFLNATGMTYSTIRQIERARYALALLKQGISILDTVEQAGYFDQPHLTRALRHFVGQTPAQITDPNREIPLSFLYKTLPLQVEYDTSVRISSPERELA